MTWRKVVILAMSPVILIFGALGFLWALSVNSFLSGRAAFKAVDQWLADLFGRSR